MSKRPRAIQKPHEPAPPPVRVAIAMPCQDMMHSDTAYDLAKMVGFFAVTAVASGQAELRIFQLKSTILPAARTDLAIDAVNAGCTHVLFIDSDMRFPKETIHRLLEHGKAIVGTNAVTRRLPPVPTSYASVGPTDAENVRVYTTEASTGLEKVATTGTGVILIDTRVFQKIAPPWFHTPWNPEKLTFGGEDAFFCMAAAKAGIDVWIDHDLSKEIGHIGTFEFKHSQAEAFRAEAAQLPTAPKLVVTE